MCVCVCVCVCAQVIGALGRNGHDTVKLEAINRMYSSGGWQSVPADLRFAVYSIVVAHGGAEGFEAVSIPKTSSIIIYYYKFKNPRPNNKLKLN